MLAPTNILGDTNAEEIGQMTVSDIGEHILQSAINQRAAIHQNRRNEIMQKAYEFKFEIRKYHLLAKEKIEANNIAPIDEPNTLEAEAEKENIPVFRPCDGIWVQSISGPYSGKVFHLRPTSRSHCDVGRSTGMRFKKNAISLPSDEETSSEHGRFEIKSREIYYTDTGSSNGSYAEDIPLEPHVPFKLYHGLIITVGSRSSFKIQFSKVE